MKTEGLQTDDEAAAHFDSTLADSVSHSIQLSDLLNTMARQHAALASLRKKAPTLEVLPQSCKTGTELTQAARATDISGSENVDILIELDGKLLELAPNPFEI